MTFEESIEHKVFLKGVIAGDDLRLEYITMQLDKITERLYFGVLTEKQEKRLEDLQTDLEKQYDTALETKRKHEKELEDFEKKCAEAMRRLYEQKKKENN